MPFRRAAAASAATVVLTAMIILAATPRLAIAAPVESAVVPRTDLPPLVGTSEWYAADPRSGLALGGSDPVAYFADGTARQGRETLETIWANLGWRFVSEANRAAFLRAPESYAPRLGGFDAGMLAKGRLVDGDPALFVVRRDRLYLFRSAASRDAFTADPALQEAAETAWPRLRSSLAQE